MQRHRHLLDDAFGHGRRRQDVGGLDQTESARRGDREFGSRVARDAAAGPDRRVEPDVREDGEAELLLRRERVHVGAALTAPVHETVEGAVVGDEGRLVELDGEPEEEREVRLHHGELVGRERGASRIRDRQPARRERHDLGRVPVRRLEGVANQRRVGDLQSRSTGRTRTVGERAEQAVVRVDELAAERRQAEELLPDLRPRAAGARHEVGAHGRTDRHRRDTAVIDGDGHRDDAAVELHLEHARGGVARPERADAIEDGVPAAVPQVAEVEDRVDDRRRVARRDPSDVRAPDVPDGVRHTAAHLLGAAGHDVHELRPEHPLGGHDVVAVEEHGREAARRVGEPVERKVARDERMVRGRDLERRRRVRGPGVQLVLRAVVRTGVEMAARAGLDAVAAHLHVPEERLPEGDGRRVVADEEGEVGGLGNRDRLERGGRRGQDLGPDVPAEERPSKHGGE